MKKQKGFTLIELLVVIVIMTSILILAIVSVNKISDNNKKKAWSKVKDEVKSAAKEYYEINAYELAGIDGVEPEGGTKKVAKISVGKLVEEDYINLVTNPETGNKVNKCDYVEVTVEGDKYSYKYIENDETTYCDIKHEITVAEIGAPEIELYYQNTTKGNNDYYIDKNLKAKVVVKTNGNGAIKKVLYRTDDSKDYTELVVKTTNGGAGDYYADTIEGNDNNIEFLVENIAGKKVKVKKDYKKDSELPSCGKIKENSTWTKSNVSVSVGCADDTSGCTNNTIFKTYNDTKVTDVLEIEDNAGHTNTCSVNVYVDKDKPAIAANAYKVSNPDSTSTKTTYKSNDWYNKYVYTISNVTKTTPSGIKSISYSLTGAETASGVGTSKNISEEGTTTIKYTVCNNAGTCSDSGSIKVKLDREIPLVSVVTSNKNWTNNNVNYNFSASDNISGLASLVRYTNKDGKTETETNSSNCLWSGTQFGTGDCVGYHSSNFITSDTKSYAGTNQIELEGFRKIKFIACDKAGNCNESDDYAKIDTSKPVCGTNTGSTTWTNKNRTITQNCSDTASGCSAVTKIYTASLKTDKITITDGVGNTRDCNVNVYVDKDRPAIVANAYKVTSKTSTSKSTSYASNSWYNKYVYTTSSVTKETLSGTKSVDYTTTGATTPATNATGTTRRINAEGTSTIKYRVCNNAGTCEDSNVVTVKLDRVAPTIKYIEGPKAKACGGNSGVYIKYEVSDNLSGVKEVYHFYGQDKEKKEYSVISGYNMKVLSKDIEGNLGPYTVERNWAVGNPKGCASENESGPNTSWCYVNNSAVKDYAGNTATEVSSTCSKVGK